MKIKFSKITGLPGGYRFGVEFTFVQGTEPEFNHCGRLQIGFHWRYRRYYFEWALSRERR